MVSKLLLPKGFFKTFQSDNKITLINNFFSFEMDISYHNVEFENDHLLGKFECK